MHFLSIIHLVMLIVKHYFKFCYLFCNNIYDLTGNVDLLDNCLSFKEACDLISLGVGKSVADSAELKMWFDTLRDDSDKLAKIADLAKEYTLKQRGVTERLVKMILD